MKLGRCENKDNVCGRLLKRFQKRIEGTSRKHMDLVDDINAILQGRGCINDLVANITDVIYAVIGSSIHFKDMTYVNKAHCMVPIGEGNLNWKRIIATAEDLGTEYAFVEQDNCNGEDPFDCMKRSYQFLKAQGLQ